MKEIATGFFHIMMYIRVIGTDYRKNNMEQGLGSIHQVVDWMEGDLNVSI